MNKRMLFGAVSNNNYYLKKPQAVFINGPSDSGKTTLLDSIQHYYIDNSSKIIRISSHSSYQEDQILPVFYSDKKNATVIDVKDGLPILPSRSTVSNDETVKMAFRLKELFKEPFALSSTQAMALNNACEKALSTDANGSSLLDDIEKELKDGGSYANQALDKLHALFAFKVIKEGEMIFPSTLNIISLDKLENSIQDSVEEMVIRYIWSQALKDKFLKNPVTLILDEVHHLNWKNSSLLEILHEGRKKQIRLVMASSDPDVIYKKASEIKWCNAVIMMKATMSDENAIKKIANNSAKDYIKVIGKHDPLERGEFICISSSIETESGMPISEPHVFHTKIPKADS